MKHLLTMMAVTALVTASSVQAQAPGGGAGRRGGLPNANEEQTAAFQQMNQETMDLNAKVGAARTELRNAIYAEKMDESQIKAKVAAVAKAEEDLAIGQAKAFAKVRGKFTPEQIDAIKAMGVRGGPGAGRGGAGGGRRGGGGAPPAGSGGGN